MTNTPLVGMRQLTLVFKVGWQTTKSVLFHSGGGRGGREGTLGISRCGCAAVSLEPL